MGIQNKQCNARRMGLTTNGRAFRLKSCRWLSDDVGETGAVEGWMVSWWEWKWECELG